MIRVLVARILHAIDREIETLVREVAERRPSRLTEETMMSKRILSANEAWAMQTGEAFLAALLGCDPYDHRQVLASVVALALRQRISALDLNAEDGPATVIHDLEEDLWHLIEGVEPSVFDELAETNNPNG